MSDWSGNRIEAVEVIGRERAGKIYTRTGQHKGGATVKKYDVALNVPDQPIPLLPTE